jgi:hypothetical protein
MSLINDALKKAQQLQTQGQPTPNPDVTPNAPVVAGSPRASSGGDRTMPGQFFMLLAFGAGALIAVSVLATVYLLRRPAALSPANAVAPVIAQAPAAPALSSSNGPAPVAKAPPPAPSLPAVSLPAPSLSNGPALSLPNGSNPSNGPAPAEVFAPAPAPTLEKLPTPSPITTPAVAVTPPAPPVLRSPEPARGELVESVERGEGGSLPAVSLPAPSLSNGPALSLPNGSNPSSGLDPSKPDPKILAYLDALQVAGVRVSGTGSKVLMNDRVFRENEIVDHLLGLRLKKVQSDMLTFVDERGAIYTKNL